MSVHAATERKPREVDQVARGIQPISIRKKRDFRGRQVSTMLLHRPDEMFEPVRFGNGVWIQEDEHVTFRRGRREVVPGTIATIRW